MSSALLLERIWNALEELRVELQEIRQGPASDIATRLEEIRDRMP